MIRRIRMRLKFMRIRYTAYKPSHLLSKGGHANFCRFPEIANPLIPELIPLPQIRIFLKCASPQIANLGIFMMGKSQK